MMWFISHFLCIAMLAILMMHINTWPTILFYSGYLSLGFLVTTLALNPLIKLFPYTWLIKLNRHRRELGVASFSYAAIHLLCFIIKRIIKGDLFTNGWIYFLHPGIISVFFIAFPILLVLAITSNQYSIKKLSFPLWKKLHKKVYIAEIAIFIHMILTNNTTIAVYIFIPLVILQLTRYGKCFFTVTK
ncbi:MAG: ferric reductase-like transmembrane domain-containing protein [Atribacterota bacterium]|nr:ferric reductase-like transmembrane domain-containing protein [Atribacterota bacterium]